MWYLNVSRNRKEILHASQHPDEWLAIQVIVININSSLHYKVFPTYIDIQNTYILGSSPHSMQAGSNQEPELEKAPGENPINLKRKIIVVFFIIMMFNNTNMIMMIIMVQIKHNKFESFKLDVSKYCLDILLFLFKLS